MKKTLLILSIITLIFAGCEKFDEIEASKVEIVEENIEKGLDYYYFDVEYDYPVELEAVNIYIAENNDMNNAKSYSCIVNENRFNVKIENVNFDKKYYFYYEFDDGYSIVKSEVRRCVCYNGYEYIDLGLPSGLLWAMCNVGANLPEEYGYHYAWGETEPVPNNSNCSTYGLTHSQLQSQGYIDDKGHLTAQYDAATVNWGGDWRMPTKSEMQELIDKCTWTWTRENGVCGYKVTSKTNGNYIFLPLAGYYHETSYNDAIIRGDYWCSLGGEGGGAYYLLLYYSAYSSVHGIYSNQRYEGRSVRPVIG